MQRTQLSFIRKFLLWYLQPPSSPYVNYNFTIDFSRAAAYLEQLNETRKKTDETQPRVTPQHLLTAAIGRVYAEFPLANASVMQNHIVRHRHVGVAIPVDLIAQEQVHGEFGAVIIERAEQQSLRGIAEITAHRVRRERGEGTTTHILRRLMPLADYIPQPVLQKVFNTVDWVVRLPPVFKQIHQHFPVTVLVSNLGAAVKPPKGVLTRGGSFTPPDRLLGLATLVMVFPIQEEVVAIHGKSEIRKVLPLDYIFDHRVFDGVMCGRLLSRLAEILAEPEKVFGEDGELEGRSATAKN